MNNQKGFINIVLVVVIIVLLGAVGYLVFVKKSEPNAQTYNTSPTLTATPNQTSSPAATLSQSDLNRIFELSKKEVGTKVYYSNKLGVGFTYLSYSNYPVGVTESGNKIAVGGSQTIEVFTKDPSISLEQAIKDKFLKGYNPSDCFVKIYPTAEQKLSNYVSAGISYPRTENDDLGTLYEKAKKCPQPYSETNGAQYFLMNKDVPAKFLFVTIGQDSAASDGTPRKSESDGGFNWTSSIRILK